MKEDKIMWTYFTVKIHKGNKKGNDGSTERDGLCECFKICIYYAVAVDKTGSGQTVLSSERAHQDEYNHSGQTVQT